MKVSKVLKRTIKKDGRSSLVARKISKLKYSKELNYLVDTSK
ncbi:MAG: hypothetical protein U9O24_07985 [Campylobacterota bacterium]|nr:hypothetical protein [Campylobacterota bacterium]